MEPEYVPVIGLDMSLTQTGVCLMRSPKDYMTLAVRPPKVKAATRSRSGKSRSMTARQKIERLAHVADTVCNFVVASESRHVFVEDYAYSRHSSSVTGLAELGGVLRYRLLRDYDILPVALTVSACRRFVAKGVTKKDKVHEFLEENGYRFETPDEADAFVVALSGWYLVNRDARAMLTADYVVHLDDLINKLKRMYPDADF